jgi:hypothetical protein
MLHTCLRNSASGPHHGQTRKTSTKRLLLTKRQKPKQPRTSHLQNHSAGKPLQIEEDPAKTYDATAKDSDDDDANFIGKALLASFTEANAWHTISPDDSNIMIIETPSAIPTPSTLLDTDNKPHWDIIKSIPKTISFFPKNYYPIPNLKKPWTKNWHVVSYDYNFRKPDSPDSSLNSLPG